MDEEVLTGRSASRRLQPREFIESLNEVDAMFLGVVVVGGSYLRALPGPDIRTKAAVRTRRQARKQQAKGEQDSCEVEWLVGRTPVSGIPGDCTVDERLRLQREQQLHGRERKIRAQMIGAVSDGEGSARNGQ